MKTKHQQHRQDEYASLVRAERVVGSYLPTLAPSGGGGRRPVAFHEESRTARAADVSRSLKN